MCTPSLDEYDRHVVARLIDFFSVESMPWPRRLWDVGSILALEELLEAGEWMAAGVLSPAACDWQRIQLRASIGSDVGLGENDLRRLIMRTLDGRIEANTMVWRRLRDLVEHATPDYLDRWSRVVARPDRPEAEVVAHRVAAHLLDLGFTPVTCAHGRTA